MFAVKTTAKGINSLDTSLMLVRRFCKVSLQTIAVWVSESEGERKRREGKGERTAFTFPTTCGNWRK
ncbi:MAG: hypothetical protein ACTS4U_01775 [Candidatus Hodgkinia cicadicola]